MTFVLLGIDAEPWPAGTAPPARGDEILEQLKKAMPVDALVTKVIVGIEAGETELRPGISNLLYLLSRLAPALPFGRMAKMVSHKH